MECPRRAEAPFQITEPPDRWRDGGMGTQTRSCSYCGSAHPDDFMEAVRNHTKIGPTDKSYKLYIGDYDGKFYTQHLDPDQGAEFIDLWAQQRINWGYPGGPYVRLYIPTR